MLNIRIAGIIQGLGSIAGYVLTDNDTGEIYYTSVENGYQFLFDDNVNQVNIGWRVSNKEKIAYPIDMFESKVPVYQQIGDYYRCIENDFPVVLSVFKDGDQVVGITVLEHKTLKVMAYSDIQKFWKDKNNHFANMKRNFVSTKGRNALVVKSVDEWNKLFNNGDNGDGGLEVSIRFR